MRSLSFLTTLVFTLSLAYQALASSHGALKRRHPSTLNTVERRAQFDNARMTFYKTGQGACGGFNNDNDFVSYASVDDPRPLGEPRLNRDAFLSLSLPIFFTSGLICFR